ncbi:hypothetical protein CYMTET_44352 [Cymbomonas tetramitiformis]|uniref:Uncharacterized protein n=1 Tax=Cymbomonas tetramitiformis TaxID=36881 RepID=A0AAE0C0H9_9CHLO|nr:hypothetical protein CYMTET_44352 [Cymbomonas tetramitiformis]|eukprot:gene150-271_t
MGIEVPQSTLTSRTILDTNVILNNFEKRTEFVNDVKKSGMNASNIEKITDMLIGKAGESYSQTIQRKSFNKFFMETLPEDIMHVNDHFGEMWDNEQTRGTLGKCIGEIETIFGEIDKSFGESTPTKQFDFQEAQHKLKNATNSLSKALKTCKQDLLDCQAEKEACGKYLEECVEHGSVDTYTEALTEATLEQVRIEGREAYKERHDTLDSMYARWKRITDWISMLLSMAMIALQAYMFWMNRDAVLEALYSGFDLKHFDMMYVLFVTATGACSSVVTKYIESDTSETRAKGVTLATCAIAEHACKAVRVEAFEAYRLSLSRQTLGHNLLGSALSFLSYIAQSWWGASWFARSLAFTATFSKYLGTGMQNALKVGNGYYKKKTREIMMNEKMKLHRNIGDR